MKPGRLRRHQQPAGALFPLQRRQARRLSAYARGRTDFRGVQASYGHRDAGCVFCALEDSGGRMVGIAEHSRNSMLGSGQRTDRDQILITNLSEAAP